MKFLLVGLLSFCLLFVGCNATGDNSSTDDNLLNQPESSSPLDDESSEDSSDSSSDESSDEESKTEQNENPYAGGLVNGGQFDGK